MSYILRIKLRYETEFLYATSKSIGLGLTYLSMHEILQDYKSGIHSKTNMVKFFGFFHEVTLF